jgi:hypothetical protein
MPPSRPSRAPRHGPAICARLGVAARQPVDLRWRGRSPDRPVAPLARCAQLPTHAFTPQKKTGRLRGKAIAPHPEISVERASRRDSALAVP